MPKLNDTQTVLLSAAAARDDHSLYPLPDTHKPGARVAKAIAGLIGAGFAEERAATSPAAGYREDGEQRIGVFATVAGLVAIGISDEPAPNSDETPSGEPAGTAPLEPTLRVTKAATVVALLERGQGATLPELIAATGWLPHTMRAALTGLRKKGHVIERLKREDTTCYRIETRQ